MSGTLLPDFVIRTVMKLRAQSGSASSRWTAQRANDWYNKQPFLFGVNYAPANALNQLEMWQADSFDPITIDKELAWAEAIGINTLRVFLHDLAYQQDPKGFIKRIDTFLSICQKHHIRPMLVFFDSCWNPFPTLGKQPEPTPGIHNSGWLQSPGAAALADETQYPRLERYVKAIVKRFKDDARVLMWDVWNEPDNVNENNYGDNHLKLEPANKVQLVLHLLPQVFQWVRAMKPSQPLTSGVWRTWISDHYSPSQLSSMDKIQFENSDVISFHDYGSEERLARCIINLKQQGRPIICTEFLARGVHSKFQTHLPLAKREKVGMICWGFVMGKTQTHLPWDSWQQPYTNGREPHIWFHEILHPDGTPYDASEVAAIKEATQRP